MVRYFIVNRALYVFRYPYGIDTDECYLPTQYIDGTDTYWAPFYSAIINGKGTHTNKKFRVCCALNSEISC